MNASIHKSIILFSSLLFYCLVGYSQQQEDRYRRYQEERRVITRWNSKWNPGWVYGKGFLGGIGGSISGQIRNNRRYRKGPDRRNSLQLAPTMVAMAISTNKTTKVDSMVNDQFKTRVKEYADKTTNLSYNEQGFGGYGRKFRKLEEQFYQAFYSSIECYGIEECREWKQTFEAESLLEFEKMLDEVNLVKDSFEQDSVKKEFYFDKHEEMEEFVEKYQRTKHNKKAGYKHQNIFENN